MKKIILLSTIAAISLIAAQVDISSMPQNPKRVNPSSYNEILSYHDSIKDVKKSVVNISTTKKAVINNELNQMLQNPFFKDFFGNKIPNIQPEQRKTHSLGSGVIISQDGYIVTNNHVVEDADEIVVTLLDESKEYTAKVIGLDSKTDLAVIKIDAKSLIPAKFGDSNDLMEGDVVFAIGNPFGVGGSVTQGIVSALNKSSIGLNQYENFIQTDASINPGNSGGALVDSRGALIGINSAILSRSGGNNGIGFAIPSNMVKNIAKSLVQEGKIDRGYIGVSISDLTQDLKDIYKNDNGALVLNVEPDSPAFKAGLQRGDLIIQISDQKIKDANDLKNIVGGTMPGKTIVVKFERDTKVQTTQIKLANMDKSAVLSKQDISYIDGLTLEELDDKVRYKYQIPSNVNGVLINGVKMGSKAQEFGFMPGDIIVQIDQSPIKNIKEMGKALNQKKSKKVVFVNRNGYHIPIVVK